MTTQAKCPHCGHELLAQPLLTEAERLRLIEIDRELGGLAFEQGRLAEIERALRRELFEMQERLSGEAGAGGDGAG